VNQNELERLIERLRALPSETEWVEFKENNYEPQIIGEYISALSNAACLHDRDKAYLVFGIEDNTHEVKGTTFKPKQEKVGAQEIENWIATRLNPRIDFVIYEFQYKEKPLVLFEIDPTFNTPVAFKGVEHIRVGTYKKKLADFPEKARKIWAKINVRLFEEEIAVQNIDEDKVLKLIDYPEYFNLMSLPLPPNKDAILEKLAEENIIIRDGSSYSITNLGAILFAKNLTDFGRLYRKAVRVIIYKGKNRLNTIKEQQGMKGYAVGFEG
jgi:ATP-dependent DNA helicase RecG